MERVTYGARGEARRPPYPPRRPPFPREHPSVRRPERRYEPGERRSSAEPLRASWRPEPEERPEPRKREPDSRLRRIANTYGWRAYAVPILVVLTALVVFDTTRGGGERPADGVTTSAASAGAGETGEPLVSENPADPIDLSIPTAKLPQGGEFTRSGEGTWHVVPGGGESVGDGGKTYTYTVEVEDGVDPASYAGDASFAQAVEGTLSDPRSWVGTGDVTLRRVDASDPPPDFRVSLTSPDTTHRPDVCGHSIPYESSCYRSNMQGESRVVINLARWIRGALAFNGDMTSYRQYAINHEVGHALNLGHEACRTDGALAPVMMQQTFGVANDYVAKLNNTPGGDQGAVPADGKVCKPNAWPNSQPR